MGESRPRGKYSDALKRAVVAESSVPGVSVASVVRRHELNNNLVFNWRKDTRYQPDTLLVEPQGDVFLPVAIKQAVPVPVPVEDGEGAPTEAPASVPQSHGQIILELGRSMRVTLDGSFDPKAVSELIRALPPHPPDVGVALGCVRVDRGRSYG